MAYGPAGTTSSHQGWPALHSWLKPCILLPLLKSCWWGDRYPCDALWWRDMPLGRSGRNTFGEGCTSPGSSSFPSQSASWRKVMQDSLPSYTSFSAHFLFFFPADPDILNGVYMSEALNPVFVDNFERDPTLTWQYFGSSTGFFRLYPGKSATISPSLSAWSRMEWSCVRAQGGGSMSSWRTRCGELKVLLPP